MITWEDVAFLAVAFMGTPIAIGLAIWIASIGRGGNDNTTDRDEE